MLLTLSLGLVPLLFPPAFQQDAVGDLEVPASVLQDDGEFYTLDLSELDDGGLTLRQFIKICQINTGRNFTLDETSTGIRAKLDSRKLLLYGRKKIRKEEFYSFFQIMMKIHGFVCVQQGSGDLAVIVITEQLASNLVLIKSNARYVDVENVSEYADKPGTYLFTTVPLKYADPTDLGTKLRTAIGSGAGDQSAFMDLGQERALLIQGYGPFVAASVRMVQILDRKPEYIKPEFRKIRLREASAEELSELLAELVENMTEGTSSNRPTSGRNNRQTQVQTRIATNIVSYQQDNSLLITADPDIMDSILDLVAQLDTKVEEPQSNYHVYVLQYLSAADLKEPIERFIEKTESERERVDRNAGGGGSARANTPEQKIIVEVHEETNSLMVTATRTKWAELRTMLDTLDKRQSQVLIETALIEVSSDFSKDIGIEYANLDTPTGDTQRGFGFTSVGITSSNGIGEARLPSPTAAGLTLGIFDGADLGIPFIIQMAQSRSDANILSVPSVLVANNKGAAVTSEDRVPYQTTSSTQVAQTTGVDWSEAGITLAITPSISAHKYLRLAISLEVSSFRNDASASLPPSIITRTIKTSVNLPDGATMWLGGIIRSDVQEGETGIPYLSDIPLIGGLFGSTSKTNTKTTLFFFCTPRILEDFQELDDISQQGKARAAETIGFDRVRMIDPNFNMESPVDVILDQDGNGQAEVGSLNLSGFAKPSYSTSGGANTSPSSVNANNEATVKEGQ
jgi:general secretion pathway protein D